MVISGQKLRRSPLAFDYSSEQIGEVFRLGWKMWYKHVLLRKPGTLWFFLSSEIRRNGLFATGWKAAAYFMKTFTK